MSNKSDSERLKLRRGYGCSYELESPEAVWVSWVFELAIQPCPEDQVQVHLSFLSSVAAHCYSQ